MQPRKLSREFKLEAVRLVRERGQTWRTSRGRNRRSPTLALGRPDETLNLDARPYATPPIMH